MPQENYQKINLLKIMEILRQETDEEHPILSIEISHVKRSKLTVVLSRLFRFLL